MSEIRWLPLESNPEASHGYFSWRSVESLTLEAATTSIHPYLEAWQIQYLTMNVIFRPHGRTVAYA